MTPKFRSIKEELREERSNATISGVILAGKRTVHNQLIEFAGDVNNKALIEIEGRSMIQHVISALNESKYIKNIYLVAPEDFKQLSFDSEKPLEIIPCGDTVVENLMIAIRQSGGSERVVITTCDNPLFRGFMLDEFIQRCLMTDADFCYSVGRESIIKASYPEMMRTYVPAKDDGYTGANVYFVNKERFSADGNILAKIDSYRKMPWKYVKLLGWIPLMKFAFKQITLEEVEKRASEVIGCKVKLIPMPYPECGIDVDKASDLTFVRELVQTKGWPNELIYKAA